MVAPIDTVTLGEEIEEKIEKERKQQEYVPYMAGRAKGSRMMILSIFNENFMNLNVLDPHGNGSDLLHHNYHRL